MKILHVIPSMNLSDGGPPRVAHGLASALAKQGNGVTILTRDAAGWGQGELSADNLCVVLAGSPWNFLKMGRSLVSHHDVVHFHGVWSPIMSYLAKACFCRNVPYVIMPHGALDIWAMQQKPAKKNLYMSLIERQVIENASALHLLNEEEVRGIRHQHLEGRFFRLPNGINVDDWAHLPQPGEFRAQYPTIGDKTLIVFMARLHHKKGPDLLAAAFADVAAEFPDSFLVLAGPDYGMRDSLAQYLAGRGLEERSLLPGMLTGRDRMALLQDANIFALPSHQEGHPMSVVEAAYLGKCLLITPECHCSELPGGFAAEVVSDCREDVANGLRRLLADAEYRQRLALRAKAIASDLYLWDRIAVRLAGYYELIIAGQPGLDVL